MHTISCSYAFLVCAVFFVAVALVGFCLCLRKMRFKVSEREQIRQGNSVTHLIFIIFPSLPLPSNPAIDRVTGYSRPRQGAENPSEQQLPACLLQLEGETHAVKTISAFALDLSDSN